MSLYRNNVSPPFSPLPTTKNKTFRKKRAQNHQIIKQRNRESTCHRQDTPDRGLITHTHCTITKMSRLAKEYLEVQKSFAKLSRKKKQQSSSSSSSTSSSDNNSNNKVDLMWLKPVTEDNMYQWQAKFIGPRDTPYANGHFEIKITVSPQYPLVPPKASFITKIFHPNVHFKTGEICLDILKNSWSPAWTLSTVCRAIISLLSHPEPDSPLNCDAGNLLRYGDTRGFNSLAKMYTALYATEDRIQFDYSFD